MKTLIHKLSCAGITSAALCLISCADNPADGVEKAAVEENSVETKKSTSKPDPSIQKQTFVITKSSKIEFVGSNVTKTQPGGFSNFVGKFEIAGDALAADGIHTVAIDMTSVFTNSEKLTEHLISEDFFDAKKFPSARFKLNKAVSKGDNQYQLSGKLDLHGVAKNISFPASIKITDGANLAKVSAEFSINRKDFDIVYPGKPDDLIRDEVVIKLDIAAMPGEPKDLQIGIGGEPIVEEKVAATQENRPEGARRGGPGRPDWRNMSQEEREEARKKFIAEIDKNKDGQLGKDEVPERMWSFISRADKNGDDKVSEAEGKDYRAEREAERAVRELSGEDAGGGPGGGRPGGRRPPENTNK